MSDKWITIAEAATHLKVHPRTIERRIAGGRMQTRRAEDGILQVLIDLPDNVSDTAGGALETVRELAADQVSLATGSASAIVKFVQDDAIRTRDELYMARQDVGRARRWAVLAWMVVAILGVGATVAVGWTASTITRSRDEVRNLSDRARQLEENSRQTVAERDAVRQEVERAHIQTAETAARLAIYMEQSGNRPTTRPANWIDRLATAFSQQTAR